MLVLPSCEFVLCGVTEEIVYHWVCVLLCVDMRSDARSEVTVRSLAERKGWERGKEKLRINLLNQLKFTNKSIFSHVLL